MGRPAGRVGSNNCAKLAGRVGSQNLDPPATVMRHVPWSVSHVTVTSSAESQLKQSAVLSFDNKRHCVALTTCMSTGHSWPVSVCFASVTLCEIDSGATTGCRVVGSFTIVEVNRLSRLSVSFPSNDQLAASHSHLRDV